MTVDELRKRLKDVPGDMPIAVVNDYGDAEIINGYGIGVEKHPICDQQTPWDYKLNSKPTEVFVFPNTYIYGSGRD